MLELWIGVKAAQYHNLPKISPPSKIRPPPFLNEVATKDAFLSKVRPTIYAAVQAVMLSKKHKEVAEGRHAPLVLLVSKCMTKRGIAESLHA